MIKNNTSSKEKKRANIMNKKELQTIEEKRIRDEYILYFKKPESYVSPTNVSYDTLSRYAVDYDYSAKNLAKLKKSIDLNLVVKVDGKYYPWYAVHDVINLLIDYAKNHGGENWGFNYYEIKEYIEELNLIKSDFSYKVIKQLKHLKGMFDD